LIERRLQFFIVERNQHLPGLNGVALPHQYFFDAAADFRADADIARFDRAGTLQ